MIQLKKSPVTFNEDEHRYFLGSKELRGVTSTLIKRAFPNKYQDIDPEVLANAARKGHELHSAIEFYDNFAREDEPIEDERVKAYAGLKSELCMKTIANEYLVSDEEHYASSIDIVMQDFHGDICLVDLKTTYNLDKQSTGLQLSIYKRFFEMQNPDLRVKHIYVLWLPNRDHSIIEFNELSVVADETIDALIDADLNDKPFIFELIPDEWRGLEMKYKHWLEQQELVTNEMAKVKERMMQVMTEANISAVKTDDFTVSYIPAKTSKRFDSTRFKAENKDLYASYMKESETAATIRVLPKKDSNG